MNLVALLVRAGHLRAVLVLADLFSAGCHNSVQAVQRTGAIRAFDVTTESLSNPTA